MSGYRALTGVQQDWLHAVAQTQEIGVRIALGAATGAVLWMVIGMGSRLSVIGVVLGAWRA
jgi:hypothetical protein